MAKFTVFFKDKAIQSNIYEPGVIHVGRDDTNDLIIDNLAVAPAHAVIIIKDNGCIIKQLNDDFPLVINNTASKETLLQDNDRINIGKHSIVFNATESIPLQNNNRIKQDIDSLNGKIEDSIVTPDANLQILNGQHIGRILPLKKAITRFGHGDTGVIGITKETEGYSISSIEGNGNSITINNIPLADSQINLNNNDIVVIDNITMQFFLDS